MSDTILEKLVASLELRTDNFEKSLAKIRAQSSKHTAEMAGDFHKLTEAVIETGKRVGETFGITLGAAALYEAPKQIMEIVKSVGELKTAAERAGVSIEELQKLNFAAIGTGLGQDQLVEMMGQFNKRIGEAATKGGDLKKLLDANGVALRNSNGEIRSASDLLGDVADLVKNTRSDQEATVIATMAFGKAGADVLSFLRQGKEEINAQKQAAQELGAVIGSDIVNKADEFDKRWEQTWTTWTARGKASIATVFEAYADWAEKQAAPDAGFRAGRTVNGQFVPADQTGLIHPFDAGRVDLPGGLGPRTVVPGPMFGPNPAPANWKSAYDQQVEGLQKHIAAIQAETAAYGQSAGAIARAKAEADALAAIKAKDGVVTDAEVEGLKKYLDQLQKVTDAQEEAAKRQKAMADASQELTSGAQDFVHTLIEGGDALKSLQQTLLKILESIIDANLFGSGPFAGLFGTQGQNGMPGGVLGNLIASAFKPGAAPASIGANLGTQMFGPSAPQGGITQGPLSGNVVRLAAGGANPFLDFIARHEGTAGQPGGGYNTSLGYGRFLPGGHEMNLTGMTLDQIHGLQRQMLANPENPFNSSAIGRYQITDRTMMGLRQQMGLSGDELFSPQLQDRMALRLMLNRGGNAAGLRNEWASLKNVPASDILQKYQQQIQQTAQNFSTSFSNSLQSIPAATTAAGGNFTSSFGSALQSILSSLGSILPGGGNIGSLLSPLLGGGGKLATGGFVRGPGSSTSDSVPTWLSNGEFVVNADAAKRYSVLLGAINDGVAPQAPAIPRLPSMNIPVLHAANSNRPNAAPVTNIHNYHGGADVTARTSFGADGSPQTDIIVRQIDRHMQTKYGLTPQVRRRG